jgi:hypothetical protein
LDGIREFLIGGFLNCRSITYSEFVGQSTETALAGLCIGDFDKNVRLSKAAASTQILSDSAGLDFVLKSVPKSKFTRAGESIAIELHSYFDFRHVTPSLLFHLGDSREAGGAWLASRNR